MILNNLFLFILPSSGERLFFFCAKVFSPFLNSTHNHSGLIDLKWEREVSIVGDACTVCVCFDTSPFRKGNPRDYRWTLTGESLFIFVNRHWMLRRRRGTSWCNVQWDGEAEKKGKNDLFTAELPVGTLWSTLRIDSARSIGLKFIWYWESKYFAFVWSEAFVDDYS